MSKVIYNLLWRKVYHNSEPPCQANPRELQRPKRTNMVLFSSCFFSSDHVGISTVAAIATRVPHSRKCGSMIQLYVLRYVVEAIGNIRRIGLNILNGLVPLLIGMILS
jgi:hypothetical protein